MGAAFERPVTKGKELTNLTGCRDGEASRVLGHPPRLTDGAVEVWDGTRPVQLDSFQLKLSALFSGSSSGQGLPSGQ